MIGSLLVVLLFLQILDLHSSLTVTAGVEANRLVNLTARHAGGWVALVIVKLFALAAIASIYWVWARYPRLRVEVLSYSCAAVAVYAVVVFGNYGGGL